MKGGTGLATLFVLLSALCFGAISTLVLVSTSSGAPLFTTLALRYFVAAAILMPYLVVRHTRNPLFTRDRAVRVGLAGGIFQALIAGITLTALHWISAATLGFLFYTYPAWVAFFAVVRHTESLDRTKLIALVLSLSGIAFIVGSPGAGSINPIGLALALGGAVLYALYLPFIRKLQGDLPPSAAAACVTTVASVIFVIIATTRGEFTLALPAKSWEAIVTLGLVCTVLAFVVFLRGLKMLGPVRTSIISTIEPFFTAVLAFIVLGQPLTGRTMIGGVLIALAVLLLQVGGTRANVVGTGIQRDNPATDFAE